MISWDDSEVDVTWYFTLSGTISFTLLPFCLAQIMFGDGIPLALQVKLTEEPSLADTTLGGIIVEFEESKTRGSEKQNLSVKEGTTLTTVCYKKLHE